MEHYGTVSKLEFEEQLRQATMYCSECIPLNLPAIWLTKYIVLLIVTNDFIICILAF